MVLSTMVWAGAGGMIKEFFLNPSMVILPLQLGKTPSFHWMASVPIQAWQSTVTAMQAVLIITDVHDFPPHILTMGGMVYLRSPEVT